MLRAFNAARNTISPLAGTYAVRYVVNGRDTVAYFVRTFDADMPIGNRPITPKR